MKDIFTPDQIALLADTLGDLMEEVDRRIAAQPSVRHCGIWKAGKEFKGGSLCTHGGSLWLARRNTEAKPGDGDSWVLVVKNGHAAGANGDERHVRTAVRVATGMRR